MITTRRGTLVFAAAAMLAFFAARDSQAHFEHMILSARSASMGGAFVAVGDDPSAVVDNAAGISGILAPAFLASYHRPYGVDGVDDGFLSAVVPLGGVTLGASWFHRGVSGALSEDALTLAVARDLKRTSEDASLSVGATVDLSRVSVDALGASDETAATFGAAVMLRPFAFIGLGYSIHNITEPSFDLIEGAGATELSRSQAFGLSYYWDKRLLATVETRQDAAGDFRPHGGLELRVENHVMLRGGLDGQHVTAGVGIRAGAVIADIAMTSHDEIGSTYFFTLRYSRPVEGVR